MRQERTAAMGTNLQTGVTKTHPASREILPDDPMQLNGFQVPGDPELMLRMLVEEYARLGWKPEAIVRMIRDPNYRLFGGLSELFGEKALQQKVEQIVARCGVIKVSLTETEAVSEQLVQIELPNS